MAPGQRLDQAAGALDRHRRGITVTALALGQHRPAILLAAQADLVEGEQRLAHVGGDAAVDDLHLARLAFEGGVELAPEGVEIVLVDGRQLGVAAGEIGEELVGVGQLPHQYPALLEHLDDAPAGAVVHHLQVVLVPAPGVGEGAHHVAAPVVLRRRRPGQLLVGLEIETAPHQLQPLLLLAPHQVLLQLAVEHQVGVEAVEVDLVVVDRLLEAQAEQVDVRVLAGVDLHQQQLEHRFVGRVDPLEELPQGGAEELLRRHRGDAAEIDALPLHHQPPAVEPLHVGVVVALRLHRHQPPDGKAPRQQQRGAVELLQQQIVLGAAAALGGEIDDLARLEALRIHQEEVDLQPLRGGPLLDGAGLGLKIGELVGVEIVAVAEPDVEIALLGVGHRAGATHQEHRLDVVAWQGPLLVVEAVDVALGRRQCPLGGGEVADPRRRRLGDVPRQARVVDVEEQGQKVEEIALVGAHARLRAAQPLAVEHEETLLDRVDLGELDFGDSFQHGTHLSGYRRCPGRTVARPLSPAEAPP